MVRLSSWIWNHFAINGEINMATLEDTVREVVQELMDKNELFTALDVSNKVKQVLPQTTHRATRDVVRAMFVNEIEPRGWARTSIAVTAEDGSPQYALLYHPLSDTFDLDVKYGAQQRQQTAVNPVKMAQAVINNPPSHWGGALPPATPHKSSSGNSATVTVSATTAIPMPTARDLWKQLFATQPSMFPNK